MAKNTRNAEQQNNDLALQNAVSNWLKENIAFMGISGSEKTQKAQEQTSLQRYRNDIENSLQADANINSSDLLYKIVDQARSRPKIDNGVDDNQESKLYPIAINSEEMVKYLLDKGAEIQDSVELLKRAAVIGNEEILKILIKSPNLKLDNDQINELLDENIKSGALKNILKEEIKATNFVKIKSPLLAGQTYNPPSFLEKIINKVSIFLTTLFSNPKKPEIDLTVKYDAKDQRVTLNQFPDNSSSVNQSNKVNKWAGREGEKKEDKRSTTQQK